MTAISVTLRGRTESLLSADPGQSLMEVIRDAGIDEMLAMCGEYRSCATCHVIVDEDWFERVGGPGEDENDLLDSAESRTATSRRSCQIELSWSLDGLRVTIAPED